MRLVLENKTLGRSVNIEVSDAFMQDVDDVRLIAGTECYKLVSTKSDTDKKRESLGMEFANEVFPEIQKLSVRDTTEVKKLLEEKLKDEKYKELVEISDMNMLLPSLVTAYERYAAISQRLIDLDKEIKDTVIENNTFYDYIARLRKLATEATCLKDFHEGIFKLKEMSMCDERRAVGATTVFECAAPLILEEQSLIKEAEESNKGKDISQLSIFTDKDFWIARFDNKADDCVELLDNLKNKWKKIELELSSGPVIPKFDYMLDGIMHAMRPMIDATMRFKSLTGEDSDAVAIERVRDELKAAMTEYHTKIREYEIVESLYPADYRNTEEMVFIDTRFAEYREIENIATECACTGEKYSWQDYLMKLTINYQVCSAIKEGRMDLEKLLKGKYSEEEVKTILGSSSSEVK